MRLVIHYESSPVPALEVESDGEGRYTVTSDRVLPRQTVAEKYITEDGLHVLGLIQLMFGANDSREYLIRRLNEREQDANAEDDESDGRHCD